MKYTWLVEKYLEGELSGEALSRFELEILRKPEVAEEVERIRSLNRFLKEQHQRMQDPVGLFEDFNDLENIIREQEIQSELEGLKVRKISSSRDGTSDLKRKITETRMEDALSRSHSKKILVNRLSVWITAASVAVLLAVGTVLLVGDRHTDYADLYAQFYSPRIADVERSIMGQTDDPYHQALRAYNNGEFARALSLFESIPEGTVSSHYFLYMGLTAMELGDYPLAIEILSRLDDDVILRHEGMWYKSLCYLGMEQPDSARQTLQEIIRDEGYHKNNALALLRKL